MGNRKTVARFFIFELKINYYGKYIKFTIICCKSY